MMSKWKVTAIIITTVAKMAFVSPALAQSFDPEIGSGNVLVMHEQVIDAQQEALDHGRGNGVFAMVPRTQAGGTSEDPANTGGGSIGYNEKIRVY